MSVSLLPSVNVSSSVELDEDIRNFKWKDLSTDEIRDGITKRAMEHVEGTSSQVGSFPPSIHIIRSSSKNL